MAAPRRFDHTEPLSVELLLADGQLAARLKLSYVRLFKRDAWERAANSFRLSPSELVLAVLMTKGHSNAEIAKALKLRPGTIHTHMRTLFAKLGVRNRTRAALKLILATGVLLEDAER